MKKISPASRQASVASLVFERLLLELRRLPGAVDRRGISAAMETAVESLTELGGQDVDAHDHLDVLTKAQGDVTRARSVVETKVSGHKAGRFVHIIRAVEAALDARRHAGQFGPHRGEGG